ncbi:MAG: hypothetical protein Q4B28_06855 [bacterium]|nr:hypothetical protein [bacterium]
MIKKERSIRIIIEKKILRWTRKKEILIRYGGATMAQHLQLMEAKSEDEKAKFFLQYLKEHSTPQLTLADLKVIKPQLEAILEKIVATAFTTKGNKTQVSREWSPYASYLVFIVQELGIEPRVLMDYTLQEIDYLVEGLTRNLNARTEEGQKQNRLRSQEVHAEKTLAQKKKTIDAFLKS